MKNGKKMTLAMMLAAILVLAAACSSGGSQGSGSQGTTAPPAGSSTGTAEQTGQNSAEESKEPVKVRFSEVIRSIFYAPHYVAMEKGFYAEEGIEVDMVTAQGSDKGAAALLADTADISLIGPETTIYIFNQEGDKKIKVFHQLTKTDGSFLLSREPMENFQWSDLAGKSVVSWRPGSAPQMVMSSILKKNNVENVELITNIASTAMVGAFNSGQGDFIQVYEPLVSMLDTTGGAHYVASLGEGIGRFPETSFVATAEFIENNPDTVRRWSNAVKKATEWVLNSSNEEVAKALAPYFEGTELELITKSVERYKAQNTWDLEPKLSEEELTILQDVLVENGVLKPEEKVSLDDVTDFSFMQ
jgi:NitT/TauT family transport system substrate-binding protein